MPGKFLVFWWNVKLNGHLIEICGWKQQRVGKVTRLTAWHSQAHKRGREKKDTCVWNSIQNRSLASSGRIARASQRLQESCKWSHCLLSTNTNPTKHMPANTQANREMTKLYLKERSHTAPYFDFIYFMLADFCFVTPWLWVLCVSHNPPPPT